MAKRFTDTGKWKRPWFRTLGLHAKILWLYLIDDCDHAGIWIEDFEVTSARVGFKVDEEKLRQWLGNKIVKIDHDRYFIPSFFEYQYGDAKDGFKAKQSALKALSAWNLLDEANSLRDLTNSYLSVTEQSPDCHIKIKSNSKININTGDARGEEFEAAWKVYPRKTDKSDAKKAYLANVNPVEAHLCLIAIENYRAYLKANSTEAKFIKHGATFFNGGRWRDWLEVGASDDFSNKPESLDDLVLKTPGVNP